MSIPPRQLTTASTAWNEQSIESLQPSSVDYSIDSLSDEVAFDHSSLMDLNKFKQTVNYLKNVLFELFNSQTYSLSSIFPPYSFTAYEIDDGCKSIDYIITNQDRQLFTNIINLSLKCLSHKIDYINILIIEEGQLLKPDELLLDLLQLWLLKEVRGHYPAELVKVFTNDQGVLKIQAFNTTNELNSQLTVDFYELPGMDPFNLLEDLVVFDKFDASVVDKFTTNAPMVLIDELMLG